MQLLIIFASMVLIAIVAPKLLTKCAENIFRLFTGKELPYPFQVTVYFIFGAVSFIIGAVSLLNSHRPSNIVGALTCFLFAVGCFTFIYLIIKGKIHLIYGYHGYEYSCQIRTDNDRLYIRVFIGFVLALFVLMVLGAALS
jgi:hypothetical protein